MSEALGFPDPARDSVTLATLRATLPARAAAVREDIRRRESIPDALELARRLEAFRRYVQDREGRDLFAAETRRTEILIGGLLGPSEQGRRNDRDFSPHSEKLAVPRMDASRFRRLAAYEPLIEQWLAEGIVARPKLLAKLQRREENAALPQTVPAVAEGDFEQALAGIPDGTVSLILTDPPYDRGALPLYDRLGAFAARVLRPGGSLLCYTGPAILPDVFDALGAHLRYWWTVALLHQHGRQSLQFKRVLSRWKPVVWYVKGERLGGDHYLVDVLYGSAPEKSHHEWAQGIDEVKPVIEHLTEANELVVDPFAGSGAFGRAALALGRRFVGADLQPPDEDEA